MRIGLAIETDSPGGAETMMLALAKELLRRGHEVLAIGPAGLDGWLTARFEEQGIERRLLDIRAPFGLDSAPQVGRLIQDRRLDVLHSHEFLFAVSGALGARAARCRHVITMHGGLAYSLKLRRRLSLRAAASMSHALVAVSASSRQSLAAALHLREHAVSLVHNGLDHKPGYGADCRRELGIGSEGTLILAVGSLYEVKGHSFLIEALGLLRDMDSPVHLAIAGTGYHLHELRATAEKARVADRTHFLGYRADVADLLAGADIFAMPSLSEGMPMAIIEAMLAGKAIVASDVGGIPEMLPSEDVGLLATPGDPDHLAGQIKVLVADPMRRARLGATARARAAAHFSASAMADRYLALYGADESVPAATA